MKDLVSALIGRKFVAASGNIARVERLGPDAIRGAWSLPPHLTTMDDKREFDKWALAIIESGLPLGDSVEATVCDDPIQESQMYADWKRTLATGDKEAGK